MKRFIASATFLLMGYNLMCAQQATTFIINTDKPSQKIEHFGASDAWSMQRLGLWPEEKQKQIADWLFSRENEKNGQPKGIGLSIWRFNIGAGSAEQGDNSQINEGTRTECFLNPDGTYNWEKQKGQRNFLKLAKERGVPYFIGFLNSPPVFYTENGLATNTGRNGTFNLKDEHYNDFSHFIADVVEGLKKHDGIHLDYVCPVNEPDGHWNWTGPKQEGSPATNREISKAIRYIGNEFKTRKIDTQILINESSDYRCMYSTHMTNWERGYHIQSFFSPDSTETYVGEIPNVPKLIAGHSYWTNTPLDNLRNIRCQLSDTLNKYKVNFWQTEVCIMGNDEEIGGGGGYDFSMKTALYVARMIHHDFVYAGAKSWQWWRAVGGDYKDGLIREYPEKDGLDGTAVDSKLMWALGNYSRFILPNARRFEIIAKDNFGEIIKEGDTDPKGIMCSAYKNDNGQWVTVVINYAETNKEFSIDINDKKIKEWTMYRTSDANNEHITPVGKAYTGRSISIPPRSVVTFVSKI